jgi:methylenetetrahydrofolate dehydrogenase (NADP+) / methenyltetrahydrofolate cyclohydrolase
MPASIIDGKQTAEALKLSLKKTIEVFLDQGIRAPGLAVILVGDDPASHFYVSSKEKSCASIGIKSFKSILPASASEDELIKVIEAYNSNPEVDGILLQLPLPAGLKSNTRNFLDTISADKDVDGLTTKNLGRLFTNSPETIYPCTPKACLFLLEKYGIEIEAKKVLVIGRSELVGKPISLMLNQKNASVTMAHSKTKNLEKEVSEADILLAAIGVKEFIKGSWIKDSAVVIDVGINSTNVKLEDGSLKKKLFGDVEFETALKKASWISPVPGGVGPMTVAMLLDNTVDLYKRHLNIK